MYSKLTIKNSSVIKRFSHTKRFKIALDLLRFKSGESILDYGTGDGYFLISLVDTRSDINIFGYEPVPEMFDELQTNLRDNNCSDRISVFQELNSLERKQFEKITCFEVLEHLDKNLSKSALRNMKTMLKENGVILISVPIEVGFSSLLKNVLRILLGQKHRDTHLVNMIKSLIGIEIKRESSPYIPSHIGFYFYNLEKIFFEEGLVVKQKTYSPFKYTRSFINSQIFYVLSARAEK